MSLRLLLQRLFCVVGLLLLGAGGSMAQSETAPAVALEERGFPAARKYLPSEYDGHNQIWDAGRTSDGLLYFGAHGEVLEFDGINWRKIPVPGAAFVRGLAIDAQDRIWVGGVNEFGEIRPGPDGRLRFHSLRDQLPADLTQIGDIRTIHALPEGVYFQSDQYLLRWDGRSLLRWDMHEKFICLAVPFGDRLILCRTEGWQMPTPDGGWETVPWQPDPEEETLISDLVPDGRGGWWGAATRHGVLRTDLQSSRFVSSPVADYIRQSRLMALARLDDGRLLWGTLGRGLLVTDADLNPLLLLDESNVLPSSTVINIRVMPANIVWVCTENGLSRLDFSPGITRYGRASGVGANGVESVARINGETVLATNQGPLVLRPGEGLVDNPQLQPWVTVEDNLNLLFPLDDGVILGGLQRIWWVQGDQIEAIRSPSNIRNLLVHSRFPDRLFGLHLTGLFIWRRDGDSWEQDHPVPEPRGEFGGLAEDPSGDLWIGSNNDGLWRLPYSQIERPSDPTAPLPDPTPIHYNEHNGLPTYRDRTTVRRIDGTPLFMTGEGFFRHDAATDQFVPEPRYGARFVDGRSVAYYICPSPRGGVWVEARPREESRSARNEAHQIGRSRDGVFTPIPLPDLSEIGALDSLSAELVDGEEILWICGRNGLLRVNVDKLSPSPSTPLTAGHTLLHSVVTTNGKQLADHRFNGRLRIAPDDNSLRFHFGTPALAGEEDRLHTSSLIGFVGGVEEVNNSGERTFTNLPPGTYTFEARGRTADHRWSEPTRFEFDVLAPWWLTPTAKTLYVLAAALAVYLIVRWRTRRLVHQRAALEVIVAERTAELANKAQALERLHRLEHDETLAARLAAETARLELLRYQLNPHFLFNSLNSIRALVHSAPESASEMVTKLAEFCRRTLNRGSDEMVSVDDEVEMARNYLEIEEVRWQDGLQVQLDIDPAASACLLPQNLLLPLLENAIKYGGRTSEALLEVALRIRRTDTELHCEVSNTGHWVEPSENPFSDSTRIGLQNLRQRLARHYGDVATVTHHEADGHVIITVTLPCHPTP
ncbi:sensor histidine kinase [Actomonas aquatica]|uniref:Histidine kinase n=1 Tax=Actomonas aquatica TaxID=2866162 RepID=A0ABZ1C5J6_9BACT|nr:sensor histidine kinase [Opitutus sp. WL0086]WRQ86672.1 histidine kinase [Opitutus sp. WL0086]